MRSSHPPPAATKPVAPAVEAMGLARRFGPVQALAGISLTIRRGEFFSLLGPSGCGKTTLLRLIAGLDLPDAGSLKIGGVDTREIPAHQRPVNTVFQSYALFPHLTVRDNVAFGLRMKRVPAGQIAERVERVLALMQIPDLAERRPAQLSGGQQQRVALARALVNEPEVLLLDEPLGALDLKLRKQLQAELHQLQRRLGITFIYVTHDQDEALVMSDRIAVMNAGRIEQLDPAQTIYERPRTRFVAGFLGSCNLIEGRVTTAGADGWDCQTALGRLRIRPGDRGEEGAANAEIQNPKSDENPGRCALPNRQHGNRITLAIRPEKLRFLRKDESPPGNCVAARIEDRIYSGSETQYRLRAGEIPLKAVALNTGSGLPGLAVGSEVLCHLPETALIPLDD